MIIRPQATGPDQPESKGLFRRKTSGPIVIDRLNLHSDTPEVTARLDRIAQNYQQFEVVFAAIESQLTLDLPTSTVDEDVVSTKALRRRKPR